MPRHAGSAIGYNMLISNLGGVVGPPAFGLLVEAFGDFTMPWLITALCVALAGVLLLPSGPGRPQSG